MPRAIVAFSFNQFFRDGTNFQRAELTAFINFLRAEGYVIAICSNRPPSDRDVIRVKLNEVLGANSSEIIPDELIACNENHVINPADGSTRHTSKVPRLTQFQQHFGGRARVFYVTTTGDESGVRLQEELEAKRNTGEEPFIHVVFTSQGEDLVACLNAAKTRVHDLEMDIIQNLQRQVRALSGTLAALQQAQLQVQQAGTVQEAVASQAARRLASVKTAVRGLLVNYAQEIDVGPCYRFFGCLNQQQRAVHRIGLSLMQATTMTQLNDLLVAELNVVNQGNRQSEAVRGYRAVLESCLAALTQQPESTHVQGQQPGPGNNYVFSAVI